MRYLLLPRFRNRLYFTLAVFVVSLGLFAFALVTLRHNYLVGLPLLLAAASVLAVGARPTRIIALSAIPYLVVALIGLCPANGLIQPGSISWLVSYLIAVAFSMVVCFIAIRRMNALVRKK